MVGGGSGAIRGRWALNGEGRLERGKKRVGFEGRRAMIRYRADDAQLTTHGGHNVLEVTANRGPLVMGFGADDLNLERLTPSRMLLRFRDATGCFDVGYRSVLADDGTLRRWWGNIVKPCDNG